MVITQEISAKDFYTHTLCSTITISIYCFIGGLLFMIKGVDDNQIPIGNVN